MAVYKRQANIVQPKNRQGAAGLVSGVVSLAANLYNEKNISDKRKEQEQQALKEEAWIKKQSGQIIDEEYLNSAFNQETATEFQEEKNGYDVARNISSKTIDQVRRNEVNLEGGMSPLDIIHNSIKGNKDLTQNELRGANRYLQANAQSLRDISVEEMDKNTRTTMLDSAAFNSIHSSIKLIQDGDLDTMAKNHFALEDEIAKNASLGDGAVTEFRNNTLREIKFLYANGQITSEQVNTYVNKLAYREVKGKDGKTVLRMGATRDNKWLSFADNSSSKAGAIQKERIRQVNQSIDFDKSNLFLNGSENLSEQEVVELQKRNNNINEVLNEAIKPNGKVNRKITDENPEILEVLKKTGHSANLGLEYNKNDNPAVIQAQDNYKGRAHTWAYTNPKKAKDLIINNINEDGNVNYDGFKKDVNFRIFHQMGVKNKIPLTDKYNMNDSAFTEAEFEKQVIDEIISVHSGNGSNLPEENRSKIFKNTMNNLGFKDSPEQMFSYIMDGKIMDESEKYTKTMDYVRANNEISSNLDYNDSKLTGYVEDLSFGDETQTKILNGMIDFYEMSTDQGQLTEFNNLMGHNNRIKLGNLSSVRQVAIGRLDNSKITDMTDEQYNSAINNEMNKIFTENEESYNAEMESGNYTDRKYVMADGTVRSSNKVNVGSYYEAFDSVANNNRQNMNRTMSVGVSENSLFGEEFIKKQIYDLGYDIDFEDGRLKILNQENIINQVQSLPISPFDPWVGDKVNKQSSGAVYLGEVLTQSINKVNQKAMRAGNDYTEEQFGVDLRNEIKSRRAEDNILILENGNSVYFPKLDGSTERDKENVEKLLNNKVDKMKDAHSTVFFDTEELSEGLRNTLLDLEHYKPRFMSGLFGVSKKIDPFQIDYDIKDVSDSSPQGKMKINWHPDYANKVEGFFAEKSMDDLIPGDKRLFVDTMIEAGLGQIDSNGQFKLRREIPYNEIYKSATALEQQKQSETDKIKERHLKGFK